MKLCPLGGPKNSNTLIVTLLTAMNIPKAQNIAPILFSIIKYQHSLEKWVITGLEQGR